MFCENAKLEKRSLPMMKITNSVCHILFTSFTLFKSSYRNLYLLALLLSKGGGGLMGCNCKMTESILSAIILLVALFGMGMMYAKWVIVVAAAILLWHALMCKKHNKK